MPGTEEFLTVAGHRLRLTSLERVVYPEAGTTKRDLVDYAVRIADFLVPHAKDRPATRKRWLHGVGTAENPGEMFFQKNLDATTPPWVQRRPIQHRDHVNEYPLVNNAAVLVWLAQIAALEIHVPQWRFGRTGEPRNPDRFVLDLDPGPGVSLDGCAQIAHIARAALQDRGLEPLPVTSGSKGIHLYSPLDGSLTSDEASALAHDIARSLEADHPDRIVSDMKKSLRDGRVLLDWSQNNAAKTTIVPYSLRGKSRPFVAAPRTWEELSRPGLAQLEFREVLERVEESGDPLARLLG